MFDVSDMVRLQEANATFAGPASPYRGYIEMERSDNAGSEVPFRHNSSY